MPSDASIVLVLASAEKARKLARVGLFGLMGSDGAPILHGLRTAIFQGLRMRSSRRGEPIRWQGSGARRATLNLAEVDDTYASKSCSILKP